MSWRIPYVQHGRRHGRYGSDPNPDLGPRIVFGSVGDDGSVNAAGSGDWTVDVVDNIFTFTVDPPFVTLGAIVATVWDQANGAIADVHGRDLTNPSIATFESSPLVSASNLAFDFVFFGT